MSLSDALIFAGGSSESVTMVSGLRRDATCSVMIVVARDQAAAYVDCVSPRDPGRLRQSLPALL